MSPNAKPAGNREKEAQESDPKEFLVSEPRNSLKAKECYTQMTLGQGGLISITVTTGDATTLVSWCHSISVKAQNVPEGQYHQHPILQVRTLRA